MARTARHPSQRQIWFTVRGRVVALALGIAVFASACTTRVPLAQEPRATAAAELPPTHALPTASPQPTAQPKPTAAPAPTLGIVQSAPTPTDVRFSERERLAYYHHIWQIVHDNYVYQDFNGVDWNALEHGKDAEIRAATTTQAFYAIIASVIEQLGDDHSRFDTPQFVAEDEAVYAGAAGYAGIGVMLRDLKDSVLVIRVGRDGPAERAGVRQYDRIVAVDDRPIADFFAKGEDYGTAVRGAIGTTVRLQIQRGDQTLTIPIVRNAIPGDAFPEAIAERISGTPYVLLRIDSFNRDHLADLVVDALHTASPPDETVAGVIIDVRENGGGEIHAIQDVIGLFSDGGVIGTTVGRHESEPLRAVAGHRLPGYADVPIVVLIGPGTVSAAEMFASGMRSLPNAVLVGQTSAGNTENLYPYDFDDGATLWLAEVLFRQNDGTYIDNVGVKPDRSVPENAEVYDPEHDPVIQAAIQELHKKTP